jgi:hypothetical protein
VKTGTQNPEPRTLNPEPCGNFMSRIVVGVPDMKVSGDVEDMLITYALGSCIGVAVYDPTVKTSWIIQTTSGSARET